MKNMRKQLKFFKDVYPILSDLINLKKKQQKEGISPSRNKIFSLSDNFSKIMEKSQQEGISKSIFVSIMVTIITDNLLYF